MKNFIILFLGLSFSLSAFGLSRPELKYVEIKPGYNRVELNVVVSSQKKPDYLYYTLTPHSGTGGTGVRPKYMGSDLWVISQSIQVLVGESSGNSPGIYDMRRFAVAYGPLKSKIWTRKSDISEKQLGTGEYVLASDLRDAKYSRFFTRVEGPTRRLPLNHVDEPRISAILERSGSRREIFGSYPEFKYAEVRPGYDGVEFDVVVASPKRPEYIYYDLITHDEIDEKSRATVKNVGSDLWVISGRFQSDEESSNSSGIYDIRRFTIAFLHVEKGLETRVETKIWARRSDISEEHLNTGKFSPAMFLLDHPHDAEDDHYKAIVDFVK